jgi:hypothetical protein
MRTALFGFALTALALARAAPGTPDAGVILEEGSPE